MRQNFAEKRQHPRLALHIPMRYKRIEASVPAFKGSLMKDISAGGARMGVYEFLSRDLRLIVEISLLTGVEPLRGTCRVAWVKKAAFGDQYDVGVMFESLGHGDNKRLSNFILNQSLNEA